MHRPRARLTVAAAATVLSTVLIAQAAAGQAPSVQVARDQFENAQFSAAEESFERVLTSPAATRADIVDAHRYLAALAAALSRDSDAHAHAAIAVALDPEVNPPDGSPPPLVNLFSRVKVERDRQPPVSLDVAVRPASAAGTAPSVQARWRGVTDGLDLRVVVRCSLGTSDVGATDATATLGTGAVVVPIAPLRETGVLECEGTLRTSAGAVVERVTARLAVNPIGHPAATEANRSRSPVPAILGIVAGVIVVGGAAAFGVWYLSDTQAHLGGTTVHQQ